MFRKTLIHQEVHTFNSCKNQLHKQNFHFQFRKSLTSVWCEFEFLVIIYPFFLVWNFSQATMGNLFERNNNLLRSHQEHNWQKLPDIKYYTINITKNGRKRLCWINELPELVTKTKNYFYVFDDLLNHQYLYILQREHIIPFSSAYFGPFNHQI